MLAPASGKHNSGTERAPCLRKSSKPAVWGFKAVHHLASLRLVRSRVHAHVGPDAGVPIKPVFGLMGWGCPRLGGQAPARLASRQPAPKFATSHNSCVFSV